MADYRIMREPGIRNVISKAGSANAVSVTQSHHAENLGA
jgi:hypothetical protein